MNAFSDARQPTRNPVADCLRAGRQALRQSDCGTAAISLLDAARILYQQAGLGDGEQRIARLGLARRLRGQGMRLLNADGQRAAPAIFSDPDAGNDGGGFPAQAADRLADVAGCESVKRTFRARFLYPLTQPALAARYGLDGSGGVLLFGPPGTGKTMLARALAGELGIPVLVIRPAEILAKWLGDAEKKLAEVFAEARRHPAALIFIDEVDALAPTRDGPEGNGAMQRLLSQLLTELDGFDRLPGRLLFLGATNRPWDIDPALLRPGRFDALAYVPLPDREARRALFATRLSRLPVDRGLEVDALLEVSAGFSGAEVLALIETAAESAFLQACESGQVRTLGLPDFTRATHKVHRAATPELLERYTEFSRGAGQSPELSPMTVCCDEVSGEDRGAALGRALAEQRASNAGADESPAATGAEATLPLRFVHARDLTADVEFLPFVCYALQHVGINPVRRVRINNLGREESQNLVVEVAMVPEDFGSAWTCNIPELKAGEHWESANIGLPLRLDRLRQVQEKERAHIQLTVRDKDEILLARTDEIPVLAYNEWLYLPEFMELAAAFVQSNSPALHPVVQQAASRLEALCGSRAFSGYQQGSADHVRQMLTAIHDTLANEFTVDYINPPPSFEQTGQKIRLVADTLGQRRGTCFDLAILQAALWEHVGLHPCIVLVPGHALLACWLKETASAQAVVALDGKSHAAKVLQTALDNGELLLVNSVEGTARRPLDEAVRNGRRVVAETLKTGGSIHLIDIHAARRSVTPLP